MSYVALYRKFRPQVFDDVKGQDHIVTTLKNQISSDRIGHAYLFCGTRGTGKTTIAKIFARAVNCEHPVNGSPCGECETCKAIASNASINVIEIDAASNNGVDNIREIIDEVSYSPTKGRYKVYIIDEVHMLSAGAFNALLKTLEEPPEYVIFILATTEVNKIPITILSRCQRYDFHRITIDTIEERLREVTSSEGLEVEEKALRYIAKAADGSMRDSLSLLDQCVAFNYGQTLTYDKTLNVLGAVDTEVFGRLYDCLNSQDLAGALDILSDIVVEGRELTQFVNDFIWYLRNLMLITSSDKMEDVIDMSSDNLENLAKQAQSTDIETIMQYINVFSELSANLRSTSQKRIQIEMTFIKCCRPQMAQASANIEDRLRALEKREDANDKILNGIKSGAIAVASSGGNVQQANRPAAVKKTLTKALPEEINELVKNWSRYLVRMPQPARTYFTSGGAKMSVDDNNKLLIVFNDRMIADHFDDDQYHQELDEFLSEVTGKKIEFQSRYLAPEQNFEENYVDLASAINFDIITEDDN